MGDENERGRNVTCICLLVAILLMDAMAGIGVYWVVQCISKSLGF